MKKAWPILLVDLTLCINILSWAKPVGAGDCAEEIVSRLRVIDQETSEALEAGTFDPLKRRADLEAVYKEIDSVEHQYPNNGKEFDSQIKLVSDPQEGLLAKVMMIRQAQHTVDVGTYILHRDLVGNTLIKELKDALARGVNVRILVDSQGSIHPTHSELKAFFDAPKGFVRDAKGKLTDKRATVDVKIFNPIMNARSTARNWFRIAHNAVVPESMRIPDTSSWRNRRMHDKILAIDADYPDRAIAIFGGRNLADEYYGLPKPGPHTYHDMEILVKNADPKQDVHIGNTLGHHYDQLFFHLGNKWLSRMIGGTWNPRYQANVEKIENTHSEMFKEGSDATRKLGQMIQDNYLAKGFEPAKATILHTVENIRRRHAFQSFKTVIVDSEERNQASIDIAFDRLLSSAKSEVDIVSPYIELEPQEIAGLKRWLSENPKRKLRIVTNSVATGDNMPAQSDIDYELAPMLLKDPKFPVSGGQIELWQYGKLDGVQYGGKEFYGKIHAKYVVVDGKTALVGSWNGDRRSRYLNSETMGHFRHPSGSEEDQNTIETAQKLKQDFESLVGRSYLWGSEEWKKVREDKTNRLKMKEEKLMRMILKYLGLDPLVWNRPPLLPQDEIV